MASFLTAFGVGGVVARYYGLSHPAAVGRRRRRPASSMSGLVYQFAKILYSQQASSEVQMTSLVGTTGRGLGRRSRGRRRPDRAEHAAASAASTSRARPTAARSRRGTAVVVTGLGGDSVIVARRESHGAGRFADE